MFAWSIIKLFTVIDNKMSLRNNTIFKREKAHRKKINKARNKKNFFLELPKEIVILILLHIKTSVIFIVGTCKYFRGFATEPFNYLMPFNYEMRYIWSILTGSMLNCELTRDEHLVKQIFSCKSLGPMMLVKHAIALIEPIRILFDKNNMSVTDLFITVQARNNIYLHIIHKNQLKCSSQTSHEEYQNWYNFYLKILVSDHNILYSTNLSFSLRYPSFYFRGTPNMSVTKRIVFYLYPPHDLSTATFHIKL